MIRNLYLYIFFILPAIFLSPTSTWSQFAPWGVNQSRPEDLQIKLVTIDPGKELTTWWGHTGVIVEDTYLHISLFYNYGLFSFEQKNFVANFVKGRLIFWVAAWNTSDALDFYKKNHRSIRIQTLNLSPEKRMEMAKFLANNVLPQNREYLYDHYYDNCSTRVRDLIDRVLNGQFKQATNRPARMTLREHTRCHTHHNFIMDLILMFLMNDTIDKPIQIWDEMFLPTELERNVESLRFKNENGIEQALVLHSDIFYQAPDQRTIPSRAPIHWSITLILGIIGASVAIIFAYMMHQGKKGARTIFGLYQGLIGLLFGIPGLVLFLMSMFTDHVVTYHNENLFLANPFTLLLIPLGIGFIKKGRLSQKGLPFLNYILAGLGLLLPLLKILPAFDQDNWLVIALILPILLSCALSWYFIKYKTK